MKGEHEVSARNDRNLLDSLVKDPCEIIELLKEASAVEGRIIYLSVGVLVCYYKKHVRDRSIHFKHDFE